MCSEIGLLYDGDSRNISNPRIRDKAFVEYLNAVASTETLVGCKLKCSVILKHL